MPRRADPFVQDAERLTHRPRPVPQARRGKCLSGERNTAAAAVAEDFHGLTLTERCCAGLKPIVSSKCLCSRTFATYLYTFLRTPNNDLNPYLPFFTQVLNGLECDALDDLVFYPSDTCAA